MPIKPSASHQYYLYINKTCTPWDIYNPDQGNKWFGTYFSRALQIVDQTLLQRNLTFYITMTEVDELPSYGENVIVLILGDEFYRVPKYVTKVGAIYKCYGFNQLREQAQYFAPLLKPSYFKVSLLGQYLKNFFLHRLWLKLNYEFCRLQQLLLGGDTVAPLFDIQPGYFNSEELPIKPLSQRSLDVFFDGSVHNCLYPIWSLRYWSKTPKAISRAAMLRNLQHFKQKYPQFQVKIGQNSEFNVIDGETAGDNYSENMMNTKICIAPRGTTYESYRHFEAMRYGCIIVSEPLPSRWYYAGAPVVEVTNWHNLEEVLQRLLENKPLMQELHERMLHHWQTKCSEAAAGQYIAETLNGVLAQRMARSVATPTQARSQPNPLAQRPADA